MNFQDRGRYYLVKRVSQSAWGTSLRSAAPAEFVTH
jgi:hypothetical protein